ncbi:MAG TPA: CpsD/CapB family tyrosine-protein kinase [Vicinamibacterales bacterium]|nr:CpsD/CapB family tyrosine-protein kinase [Vicinamibacterales bacterium]
MSRMQNILDKAERDGAVLRIRSLPDQEMAGAVGTIGGVDTTPVVVPEPALHAPVRATASHRIDRALVAAHSPDATAARQYRGLCTRIVHADQSSPAKVMIVTSPGVGEGKTVTAANLALTLAREYQRPICLVDANLRSPRLHEMFGLDAVDATPGLVDVLAGRATLDQALTLIEPAGVTLLPAGTGAEHPAELLSTPLLRRTLDQLRTQFDRIVIDTPAVLPVVDMGLLEPLADRIVLVVRAGMTSKASIHDVMGTLDAQRLLGVVLNEAA